MNTLAKIATLSSTEEIEGWRWGLKVSGRAPEPGEMAALIAREQALIDDSNRHRR